MFNERDFNIELDSILKRNGIKVTGDQYMSIKDIYYATVREQSRQYSNYTDNVSLLEGIVQQTDQGAEAVDILQAFSDVNHFEFYETFMGSSERRRLINTLKEYGVPIDALQGVRVKVGGDQLIPYDGVTIDFSFSEDDHHSVYLEYFTVKQGEETIFDFENDTSTDKKPAKERPVWRDVEGRSSLYGGTIAKTAIGNVKRWQDKNGRIFYTDTKGHRVKVEKGVLVEKLIFGEEV